MHDSGIRTLESKVICNGQSDRVCPWSAIMMSWVRIGTTIAITEVPLIRVYMSIRIIRIGAAKHRVGAVTDIGAR